LEGILEEIKVESTVLNGGGTGRELPINLISNG